MFTLDVGKIMNNLIIPYRLKFQLTSECHSRCITCPVWKDINPIKHIKLTLSELKNIVNDFKDLQNQSKKPEVHFAGMGEPFYYPHIFELMKYSSDIGLQTLVVTNTMFFNKNNIHKIFDSGLHHFIVSLNSHIPDVHNYTRGNPNYEHIMKITDMIYNYKLKHNLKYPTIDISSILGDFNVDHFNEFIEWIDKEEKFESFNFNLISNFGQKTYNHVKQKEKLIKVVDNICNNYDTYPFIAVPKNILHEMKGFIDKGVDYKSRFACKTSLNNLFIEKDLQVRFCFSKNKYSLGDVSKESLKDILTKPHNQKILKNVFQNKCRDWCAISNCIYG